jgi:L-ascorbate metabolism protein UlaG (beta-lactamase superfamily)
MSCANKQQRGVAAANEKVDQIVEQNKNIPSDSYTTNEGELKITLVGHASLMFEYKGKIIHTDPWNNVADYSLLPKADLVLITHEHPDHFDTAAINLIKKAETRFIASKVCSEALGYGEAIGNGEKKAFEGINIEAVPAYNIVSKRPSGEFYHPKGRGNGYVLTFGDTKVYVAGDTENVPEMKALQGSIYIAFLPKNTPYTMTDEMFADAARMVKPAYLYPYHFSEYDANKITKSLSDTNIRIQVRPMFNK